MPAAKLSGTNPHARNRQRFAKLIVSAEESRSNMRNIFFVIKQYILPVFIKQFRATGPFLFPGVFACDGFAPFFIYEKDDDHGDEEKDRTDEHRTLQAEERLQQAQAHQTEDG